jgi:hypothetical protein
MKSHEAVRRKLKEFGLAYPDAHGKSPWPGHDDLAVRNKTFAYLRAAGEPARRSCRRSTCSRTGSTKAIARRRRRSWLRPCPAIRAAG